MIFNKGILREFSELTRSNVKNRHDLVLFVEPEEKEEGFDYYNPYFWNILKYLNEHGPQEWPSNRSTALDKREWKQYAITDDNESIKGKCPFHTQFNEKNSN